MALMSFNNFGIFSKATAFKPVIWLQLVFDNTAKRNNNHDRIRVGKVFRYYKALIYNGSAKTSGKNGHYIFSRRERFYC